MEDEDTSYDRDYLDDGAIENDYEYSWEGDKFYFHEVNEDTLPCVIVICVLGLVGIIGNCLMLRAWIKYPKLRNDFYTVFAAISLIDVLYISIGIPASIAEIMEVIDMNSESFCKASKYLIYASGFISAYLVVALAALRAILLTNRNMMPRPRAKHMIVASVVGYVLVFLLSIPIISMHAPHYGYCFFEASIQDILRQVWLLESFSAFVPVSLIILLYLISFILGKRYFADSYSPRERQKSRLVSCVVLAFIVCQFPYRIVSIYEIYQHYLDSENYRDNESIYDDYNMDTEDDQKMSKVLLAKDYLTCLLFLDKAIRPIICSKLTKDLGAAFDEVVNCQSCKNCYKQTSGVNGTMAQTPSLHPELLPRADTPIPPPTGAAAAAAGADFDPPFDPEPPSALPNTPTRGVDRTISVDSSNSQAPLIRNSSSSPSETELEMM